MFGCNVHFIQCISVRVKDSRRWESFRGHCVFWVNKLTNRHPLQATSQPSKRTATATMPCCVMSLTMHMCSQQQPLMNTKRIAAASCCLAACPPACAAWAAHRTGRHTSSHWGLLCDVAECEKHHCNNKAAVVPISQQLPQQHTEVRMQVTLRSLVSTLTVHTQQPCYQTFM